ncbi:MAG: hypothetical protein EPN53_09410 [Acidobacteria bacterium]|nr:MAG: hypothetical protein EPN53_09410 [Acidobacteriota bacterium]
MPPRPGSTSRPRWPRTAPPTPPHRRTTRPRGSWPAPSPTRPPSRTTRTSRSGSASRRRRSRARRSGCGPPTRWATTCSPSPSASWRCSRGASARSSSARRSGPRPSARSSSTRTTTSPCTSSGSGTARWPGSAGSCGGSPGCCTASSRRRRSRPRPPISPARSSFAPRSSRTASSSGSRWRRPAAGPTPRPSSTARWRCRPAGSPTTTTGRSRGRSLPWCAPTSGSPAGGPRGDAKVSSVQGKAREPARGTAVDSAPPHPRIRAVGRALPEHYADQETLIAAFRDAWAGAHFNVERLEELHRAVQVSGRHLALPLAAYRDLRSFAQRNDAWTAAAVNLGETAVREALRRAGLAPADVGHLFFVSTTGIATPSIDARLVNRLGLAPGVRRSPLFGLGCAGGAAGVARAADYLRAWPEQVAVVLAVELCSLTLQREDVSIPNIISSGLFGDGAAAVVLAGGARDAADGSLAPAVVATGSVFYPDTERVMGWDIVESGFKVVLSAKVPEVVRTHVRADVDGFLAGHGLARADIRHWIAHTGGPRVLEAFESALELPEGALARSWTSLRQTGNLSSASVLFVLGELLDSGEGEAGDNGLLLAMGPGFGAELVLLRW